VALVIATKFLDIGQGPRRISLSRAADSVSEQLAVYGYPGQREFRPGVWVLYPCDSDQWAKDDWPDADDAAKAECTHCMEESGRQMKLLEQAVYSKLCPPESRVTI